MRLFTAVYPSPQALAHLDLALGAVGGDALSDPGAGLRWVPTEQRHVTLAFHGSVPDGAVPGYVEALDEALTQVDPFRLSLAGSGTFGGRTLWVGLRDEVSVLRRLGETVTEVADAVGLPAEGRATGRPHLTVARASTSRTPGDRSVSRGRRDRSRRRGGPDAETSPFTAWARALAVYTGPGWPVDAVRVVASELGAGRSGGPAHHDVAVLPLGRTGAGGHLD